MRILDRYILKNFFLNVLILSTVFSILFVLVSLVVDLDEYVQKGEEVFSKEYNVSVPIGTIIAALDYNVPILVLLFVYFVGLICVAGMGFTFAQLYRSRELLAMIAGGISLYRVALPVMIAAFIINMAALPVQEYLIPKLSSMLLRSRSANPDQIDRVQVNFITDAERNLFAASGFSYNAGKLTDLVIMVRDRSGMALATVQAKEAKWDGFKKEWELTGGIIRYTKDTQLRTRPLERFQSDLSPAVLMARQNQFFLRLMSLEEMLALTSSKSIDTNRVLLVMHSRFSLVVINVLVFLIGLPFFLLREPSNLMIQGLKASGVCIGCWGFGVMLLQTPFASGPATAAWLPVILLMPVAAWMLTRVKT